jgi:heme/copper-type cytochrome/quinol oxidase subunit 2
MGEFVEWLLQGLAYLAVAAIFYVVLLAGYIFIFRRDSTVEDTKGIRDKVEFAIILIISIALAIFIVGREVS